MQMLNVLKEFVRGDYLLFEIEAYYPQYLLKDNNKSKGKNHDRRNQDQIRTEYFCNASLKGFYYAKKYREDGRGKEKYGLHNFVGKLRGKKSLEIKI